MANPFDQFDASDVTAPAPQASAPVSDASYDAMGNVSSPSSLVAPISSKGNPFDQFDPDGGTGSRSTFSTIAEAPAVGFNRGFANTIGAPVDLLNWGVGKLGLPTSQTPFFGSESIKRGLGLIGANPDDHPANSWLESGLQSAGEGAGSMVAPEFAIQGGLRATGAKLAPRIGEAVDTMFGSGASPAATAVNAAAGAVGNVAGEGAAAIAPDDYKPIARLAGNMAGGFGTAAGAVGARATADAIAPKVAEFVQPMTKSGQESLAASKFKSSFSDPLEAETTLQNAKDFRDAISPNSAMGELVPGSKPTTGQLTGDKGALSLERNIATTNPELFKENDFGTGAEQQNAARTAGLQNIQPTGAPEDVSALLRQRLQAIQDNHDTEVGSATADAQAKASGIGSGQSPEDLGASLRQPLADARQSAKTDERKLWNAVDPDGTLALPSGPVTTSADSISANIPKTAKPMSGEESAIFDAASNLPPVVPFNDLTALRSRVSTEMRNELISSGQTPTYARLTQLRGSIEDAIKNAVEHRAAVDQNSVAHGEMSSADTMQSRIRGVLNDAASSDAESGKGSGNGIAAAQAGTQAKGSNPAGSMGQGTGRSGNNAGNPGLSGNVAGDQPKTAVGPGKVYYPSGSLDVNYEVANLPDLITSHDTDFRVNPNYPAELQPRARETAPARDQVNTMAARLQPERLGQSPEANSGAPIVGPDNVVESGNGRALALGKAYQSGKAGDYRNWLESQGVDTKGVENPVLVARRQTPLTPADRIAFAHSANTSSGLRMNAAEQAAADARLITPEALSSIADGSSITSPENRSFVRSFLSQLSPAERGGMLDAGGSLSQAGVRRMEAAMASRAYGDGDFVARAFDAADPNIRGLAGGMTDASGAWMKMRQAARDGRIDPEHDITPDIMNATRSVMRARDAGRPVAEVLNQRDMFGGEASRLAKAIITNDSGGIASREVIAQRLQKYAEDAQRNLAEPGLFGDKIAPIDVLKTSLGDAGKQYEHPELASAAMKSGPVSNFDESAASRLKAASAATKARAQTFDNGPVGNVLRKGQSSDTFKMPDSSVPGKVFPRGPGGAETVSTYLKAAGNEKGIPALSDAASESLRREAMTDGVIDPAKFARWQAAHQDALRGLPSSLSSRFANAAKATESIADAALARKQAMDEFQTKSVAKVMSVSSPSDVTKVIGGILGAQDGVKQMANLFQKVGTDPNARAGLRKAIADYIVSKATGTTENGTSNINNLNASTFQKMIAQNRNVIKAAGFSDREIGNMQAIAQDMQRSQRTLSATKLPGQSNSPQDLIAHAASNPGAPQTLMSKVLASAGAGWAGSKAAGIPGAVAGFAGGIGTGVANSLRDAGIRRAGELVRDAMLNPELGLALLQKAPVKVNIGSELTLKNVLGRQSTFAAQNAARYPSKSNGSQK